jgi:hypothetical protein
MMYNMGESAMASYDFDGREKQRRKNTPLSGKAGPTAQEPRDENRLQSFPGMIASWKSSFCLPEPAAQK